MSEKVPPAHPLKVAVMVVVGTGVMENGPERSTNVGLVTLTSPIEILVSGVTALALVVTYTSTPVVAMRVLLIGLELISPGAVKV